MSLTILKEELANLKFILEGKDKSPGMVALEVPKEIMKKWGAEQKVPHITLIYFPDIDEQTLIKIGNLVQSLVVKLQTKKFEIETKGQDIFGPEKDTNVALVKKTKILMDFQEELVNEIDKHFPGKVDKKYKNYLPHITYGKVEDKLPKLNTDCSFIADTLLVSLKDDFVIKINI